MNLDLVLAATSRQDDDDEQTTPFPIFKPMRKLSLYMYTYLLNLSLRVTFIVTLRRRQSNPVEMFQIS